MVKKIEVNGKKYTAKEFDYNLMCDMEEIGFNIDDIAEKPASALRGYVALCKGCSLKTAGDEITKHMANGGDIDEILAIMTEKVENSDFFRGQQTNSEKKDTED